MIDGYDADNLTMVTGPTHKPPAVFWREERRSIKKGTEELPRYYGCDGWAGGAVKAITGELEKTGVAAVDPISVKFVPDGQTILLRAQSLRERLLMRQRCKNDDPDESSSATVL